MKKFVFTFLLTLGIFITQAQPLGFDYAPIQLTGCPGDGFAMLGIIEINGVAPGDGSWIAAFDETNNLAGSAALFVNGGVANILSGTFVYTDTNFPGCEMIDAGISGYPGNPEQFFLVVWNATDGRYYQFPNDGVKTLFDYAPVPPNNLYLLGFTDFNTVWSFTGAGFPTLSSLLPVDLLYFRGGLAGDAVKLSWATASEQSNAYFSVERSQDGRTFTAIGQVAGAGDNEGLLEYGYTDRMAAVGTNYYRLKQVDYDGTFEYSPIVSVVLGKTGQLRLAPNPVSSALQLQLPFVLEEAPAMVSVRDIAGRVVLEQPLTTNGPLDVSRLVPGVYSLELRYGEQFFTERFVKQ